MPSRSMEFLACGGPHFEHFYRMLPADYIRSIFRLQIIMQWNTSYICISNICFFDANVIVSIVSEVTVTQLTTNLWLSLFNNKQTKFIMSNEKIQVTLLYQFRIIPVLLSVWEPFHLWPVLFASGSQLTNITGIPLLF